MSHITKQTGRGRNSCIFDVWKVLPAQPMTIDYSTRREEFDFSVLQPATSAKNFEPSLLRPSKAEVAYIDLDPLRIYSSR